MFLLPIGHEEDEVRRWPWVSITIAALCIVAYVGLAQARGSAAGVAEQALEEALAYWHEHPYLDLDAEVDPFAAFLAAPDDGDRRAHPPGSRRRQAAEQAELDRLVAQWREASRLVPERRWGLVPRQHGAAALVTHLFVHSGLFHLLGNLFFLWLAGPPLEDVWGRPFFALFYLAAGVSGGLFWVATYPHSAAPLVGASGAVAGLMGAFMVRYWKIRIRFFYFFMWILPPRVYTGTFSAVAWAMLALWFGRELLSATFFGPLFESAATGVAYWVHVWGFAFGAVVALGMKGLRVEERLFAPAIDRKLGEEVNRAVEEAHRRRERGEIEAAWRLLSEELRRHPSNVDATLALWDVALESGRTQEAARPMLRLIRRELRQDKQLGLFHWIELRGEVPGVALDLDTRCRLAEACLEEERHQEAAELVQSIESELDEATPSGTLVRLARLAASARATSTVALCERALADPDLPPAVRDELTAELGRARGWGMAAAPSGAAEEPHDATGLLDGGAPQLSLQVIPAVPRRLGGDKISLDLDGQGARALPLERLQAIAAARIEEGWRPPYVVVDLLVDAPWGERPRARTVRLTSDRFDAAALCGTDESGDAALSQLIDGLVRGSGARPLPDAEAVRGQPFTTFSSVREYESKVLGRTA